MHVESHGWAYICACLDINTHITHIYINMYVQMQVYMHECIGMQIFIISMYTVRYVYRHIHKSVYRKIMCTYRHMYLYTFYIPSCINTFTCMHIGIHVCKQTCIGYICVCMHINTHTYIYIYIYIYIYYIYIYGCIYLGVHIGRHMVMLHCNITIT